MLRKLVGAVAVAAVVATPYVCTASATTFTLSGTSQLTNESQAIPPLDLSSVLSGKYDDGPCVPVPYPASVVDMDLSVAVGADRLLADIESTTGDKVAVGISQGAIAIAEAKRRLMALPADQRPAPGELTFVAIADPTRGGHGALAQIGYQSADTPYDTTYVTREYDGLADLPDRFNVLAIINAVAGILYVHPFYRELPSDIPARNITETVNGAGGTVTDILIPTAHLPMLQPLRDLGLDVDELEATLKPKVDAGYSRNDVEPAGEPVDTTPVKTVGQVDDTVGDKPEKRHRNVQASEARGNTDDVKPSKANDDDSDEKPDRGKPANHDNGDADSKGGDERASASSSMAKSGPPRTA